MATRNRTLLFRKYRNSLRSVRAPMTEISLTGAKSGVGPVNEMASTSLLHPKRSYAPVSTEDPGNSSRGTITVGLPPDWVDVSEEISVNIQRARTIMTESTINMPRILLLTTLCIEALRT